MTAVFALGACAHVLVCQEFGFSRVSDFTLSDCNRSCSPSLLPSATLRFRPPRALARVLLRSLLKNLLKPAGADHESPNSKVVRPKPSYRILNNMVAA